MSNRYQLTEKKRQARDDYENQVFMLNCYNCNRIVEVSQDRYEIGDVPMSCVGFDGKGCHR